VLEAVDELHACLSGEPPANPDSEAMRWN
jgi:hypothetical protein